MVTENQVLAGQAVYTKRVLRAYDVGVLGISNRFIWKCPSHHLVEHYNTHVSANHLDVGVGSGYFLDRCQFPTSSPRITLMDLNRNSLDYCSQRIARYQPKTLRHNVLEPIKIDEPLFDSVAINYLLHCVPGSLQTKAIAFDHLKALMNPNAVLFGSTLLQGGVKRSWVARRLMGIYNKKGIFSNTEDDLDSIKSELHKRFNDVSVKVIGCAALFAARK